MPAPTIVLVHGAFGDAAGWAPVTRDLLDRGFGVRVPPVASRTLSGDAAYVRSVVERVDGPVVLAGHSYGGAVVTVAGVAENVSALVYVAAPVLERGESLAQLQESFPDSGLAAHLVRTGTPADGPELSVEIGAFGEVLAHGLEPGATEVLAVSQRPLAEAAFREPAPDAAWRVRPAWAVVATADHTINPDVQRFGYRRAGIRHVIELDGPHLIMRTHPREVAKVIADAAEENR